jgi:hypothetical protein
MLTRVLVMVHLNYGIIFILIFFSVPGVELKASHFHYLLSHLPSPFSIAYF